MSAFSRLVFGTLVLAVPLAGAADGYPTRPVRLVVPYAPGGGTDVVGRILAVRLTERMGQTFVVDNRPAGSGIIGADMVAKAAPDGYTLLFAFSSLSSSALLFSKLPYDPVKDFAPITLVTTSQLVLLSHPSVPARDVKELIAYAKANPNKLNYGSSGPGSSPHLATELMMSMAGIQMTHIIYKGIAPAITAQLGNEVQLSFTPVAVALPHMKSGRLRALGVGGLQRAGVLPDVPTIHESGLPGFEVIAWYGMLLPAGASPALIERLNRELRAVIEIPDVRRNLTDQGMDPAGGTPAQFAALIKADMEKWGGIGKRLGIKLD
jgi:tripartite-type tricarboxylate transporter receptor subunit TctC